eukprot:scaffold340_cov256-Pinguiococcus_pyrenoidosus.AAC.26
MFASRRLKTSSISSTLGLALPKGCTSCLGWCASHSTRSAAPRSKRAPDPVGRASEPWAACLSQPRGSIACGTSATEAGATRS